MRTYLLRAAILTTIALLPLQAQAQDTRIVSDPLYLPLKGQLYGATVYTLNTPQGDNDKAGVKTSSFESSDSSIDQTLAFGVTNNLTLRVATGYASNSRDSTAAATGDVTTGNSSGFNDPTFSATYRLLEQLRAPFILDLTASYSPDAIAATSSGAGMDGNVARGGRTGAFELTAGREMKTFTIAGTATVTDVGQQMTQLLSNGTFTTSDAHWNYGLGLNTQTRFSDRVSINAGLGYAVTGTYGVSNVSAASARTYDGPNTLSLNTALNCHFLPNRFVAALTYSHNTFTDAKSTFANPASDTSVQNRTGNVVGVRLLYVFN